MTYCSASSCCRYRYAANIKEIQSMQSGMSFNFTSLTTVARKCHHSPESHNTTTSPKPPICFGEVVVLWATVRNDIITLNPLNIWQRLRSPNTSHNPPIGNGSIYFIPPNSSAAGRDSLSQQLNSRDAVRSYVGLITWINMLYGQLHLRLRCLLANGDKSLCRPRV